MMKLITNGPETKEYRKDEVDQLRNNLIELRNAAIKQNEFQQSVLLSHTIAVLALVMEQME